MGFECTKITPLKFSGLELQRQITDVEFQPTQENPPLNIKESLSYEEVEQKINSLTGFKSYHTFLVKLNREKKRIKGMYFQNDRGCILYSLINEGWVDENYIPDSMKYYKNHTYAQDEKNHKNYLIRVLSLLDLAQLWINLGGESPYKEKETQKEIKFEKIKEDVYNLLKKYAFSEEKNVDDVIPAFNIVKNHERFATIIGTIRIKPLLLSECDFHKNIEKLNLKTAIDSGFIKENEVIFCLNHFIAFNKIIEEDSKKIYIFTDSLPIFFKKLKKEGGENCLIDEANGIIKASENSGILNIEETPEKRVGILKLLF